MIWPFGQEIYSLTMMGWKGYIRTGYGGRFILYSSVLHGVNPSKTPLTSYMPHHLRPCRQTLREQRGQIWPKFFLILACRPSTSTLPEPVIYSSPPTAPHRFAAEVPWMRALA